MIITLSRLIILKYYKHHGFFLFNEIIFRKVRSATCYPFYLIILSFMVSQVILICDVTNRATLSFRPSLTASSFLCRKIVIFSFLSDILYERPQSTFTWGICNWKFSICLLLCPYHISTISCWPLKPPEKLHLMKEFL